MSAHFLQKRIKNSLLGETSVITPMDSFEHWICDNDIVSNFVPQFVLCSCLHSLALGHDQLLLQVIIRET